MSASSDLLSPTPPPLPSPGRDDAALHQLFLNDRPLLDVRAPAEFSQGAFPTAVNIPLLDDEQRHQVGLCYRHHGQQAAIALGHQLVNGSLKAQRIAAWSAFVKAHPEGLLYCFRGGLRSKITQQWLAENGVTIARVGGGYKAMRRFLMEQTAALAQQLRLIILGGRTGVGKTELLTALPHSVDLEGLANHRGSAFGRQVTEQPSQIDFENGVAIALLKRRSAAPGTPVVLEDEGRLIGSLALPEPLRAAMQQAPLVILEADLATRVEATLQEYIVAMGNAFQARYGEEGFNHFADHLVQALYRIRRRLGLARYDQLQQRLQQALALQRRSGEVAAHRDWISALLTDYYDPMYDYQLKGKRQRIVLRAERAEVLSYLRSCA